MMTETPHRERTYIVAPPRSVDHVTVWLSEALSQARQLRATDLHFFPSDNSAHLWLRIDGVLHEACMYPRAVHDRAVSRLKVLARCPDYVKEVIAEGRLSIAGGNTHQARTEARLSIIPSVNGEKAVVRLLQPEATSPPLREIGFSPKLCGLLEEATSRPQGLLLVVGPAGSGKSTTLAALLRRLHERSASPMAILTLEDPVENPLPFATQVAVDLERGLGFAQGLRALLRQDPEVLMVGEIRDPETAQVALNAALTGHRLMSSLHTLNAGDALIRLQDMGAAPHLLASAIGGILGQRLVRRPCPHCRKWTKDFAGEGRVHALLTNSDLVEVAQAAGCHHCHGIGYEGRVAVGEWSLIGAATVELLMRRAPAMELRRALELPASLREEALHALREQLTTPEEIERLLMTEPAGVTG